MKVVQQIESFGKRFNEPWMTQDSISTCGDMWIFKDAMEATKSTHRRKVVDVAVTTAFWPK